MKPENLLSKTEIKIILAGYELRRQRDEHCYSQEYMAKQLGLTQSTYQRLESVEIKISLERLIKISEIFKKPMEKLTSLSKQIEQLETIILQQEKKIAEQEIEIKKLKRLNHPNIATEMPRIT